jgi:nanoRNase/pAp phosphatase (c-di-AMP/oligoRNAs hydrolase)
VNVADLAKKYGGGGHECAAGFSTPGPLRAAEEQVLDELRGRIPPLS